MPVAPRRDFDQRPAQPVRLAPRKHNRREIQRRRGGWWTFADSKANAAIAAALRDAGLPVLDHDNLSVTIEVTGELDDLNSRIQAVRGHEPGSFTRSISPEMIEELKFSSRLPEELAEGILEARLVDKRALGSCFQDPGRHVG